LISTLAELIQQSELSQILRNSFWLYPLINTGHIFGFALLIGSIIPFDLKLLGLWPSVQLNVFVKVLRPVAITGAALAILFGLLLFITRPVDYLQSDLFISKIVLLFFALLNILLLSFSSAWQQALTNNTWSSRVKSHAFLSLILWIAILILGRLIGYR
jgi:hypothetical protein